MKIAENYGTQKLKKNIENSLESSKQTVKELIEVNSKNLNSVIESNEEFLKMIDDQAYVRGIDPSLISSIKKSFINGIELSEKTIDSLVEAHNRRVELAAEFSQKLVNSLAEQQNASTEEFNNVLRMINENFEAQFNNSVGELKYLVESYNNHVNLALNFNRKFAGKIKNQLNTLNRVQASNINAMSNIFAQWWEQTQTLRPTSVA